MTDLRIVPPPDEIDDSMFANPEDPRDELGGFGPDTPKGAAVTLEPRGRRRPGGPTHWRIVEAEGTSPVAVVAERRCQKCGEAASVLVHNPRNVNEPRRTHCPKCAGEIRRGML